MGWAGQAKSTVILGRRTRPTHLLDGQAAHACFDAGIADGVQLIGIVREIE